ncbi:MAG: hypothetical protein ACYC56_14860 [Candidatus Aquicultor sp.]
MADIYDLFDQETAGPAITADPAAAAREAKIREMLGMTPNDFEDQSYKRFWKQNYGVDEKSGGIKKFLAGLAEGGAKLAQGKERPLVRDLARKQGLEDYTAAQRGGLAELKLLDAEQKQQQNLTAGNYWKGKAFDAKLMELANKMRAQGVQEELIQAKITDYGKKAGKTDAEIADIQARTAKTKEQTKYVGMDPAASNAAALLGNPNGKAIEQGAQANIFGREVMKAGAKNMFGGTRGSSSGGGSTSWREAIIPNEQFGPSIRRLESGRSGSGGSAPQQSPQDIMQLLRQVNPQIPGSPLAPAGETSAPGTQAAPTNVIQRLRQGLPQAGPGTPQSTPQGTQPGSAAANRPADAGQAKLAQVMGGARGKQWSATVPWLADGYTEKMPGFNKEEYDVPVAFRNNIGVPPKSFSTPQRAAARQATAGFRNLATTAVNAFVNDDLKDVAGPMNQFMLGVRRYGEARPDVAISTDVLSKQTLADLVRSISGLTVSDKEQARLDNLVGSASKSPGEFMKLSLYTNMLQQRHDFADSLMLPEDIKAFVVSDPQVTEELDFLWRSVVTLAENMQKAKRAGAKKVKLNGQEVSLADAKAALDLDKMTRKTILKSVYRKFPGSDYLPQKIGAR